MGFMGSSEYQCDWPDESIGYQWALSEATDCFPPEQKRIIRLGVEFQEEELAQSFSSSLVMKLPSLSTMMGVPSIHSGQFSETQVRVAHSQMS